MLTSPFFFEDPLELAKRMHWGHAVARGEVAGVDDARTHDAVHCDRGRDHAGLMNSDCALQTS